MDLISNKFKYLFFAQSLLGEKIVPKFIKISNENELRNLSASNILRSSIKGEAESSHLLSGKSLSLPNLVNLDELKNAYYEIVKQTSLEEVILQEEIHWDQHLTLVYEKDFIFVEIKERGKEEEKPQFLYWTPIGQTATGTGLFNSLNKILKQLSSLTEKNALWLMELGQKDDELYLFQIQPVSLHFLGNIFSQNLVQEMLLSRHRFQKSHGLIAMMKTEWKAYNFRKNFKKEIQPPPSWIFLNWEFIFHYFRLYCLQKNMKPSQQSFTTFLTTGHEKSWMGEILRFHFMMANQLRLNESFEEANFVFDQNSSFIFIGKGKVTGKISEKFILIKDLTPQLVYKIDPHKIILTKTFSLLSHGILAAIEMKIRVVAGIPDEEWDKLSKEEIICLDFDTRSFEIQ